MSHEKEIEYIFKKLKNIFKLKEYDFRIMRRKVDKEGRGVLNLKNNYNLAYINLNKKLITVDIYTPRHRKNKSTNSILRILAHEIAHIQKPPYRQRYRGKWITRQHFPAFYKQVNKNIEKIKKDKELSKYFIKS